MATDIFSTIKSNFKNASFYIKKMAEAVKDVDTAMTDLYRLTDETDKRYCQFLTDARRSSKELGRSLSGLVTQTAKWAELGFSLDQAEKLSKVSSIYANISGKDDADAVSDVNTAMKAFNINAENSITIIDSLNKLSKESSLSINDLMAGLKASASSMSTAGADMDETLAMLAAGAEITGSAEEFGNFLSTAALRITGMRDELAALGEEADSSADSIGEVQAQILKLTDGQVNIFDNNSGLRDYYDIMEDIAGVYSDLSPYGQASLDELLFGSGNSYQGSALIRAFESGQVQKTLEASLNSAGSAMNEQEIRLASLAGKSAQFQAAFQSLCSKVIDSNLLKFFTDLGTAGVNGLDRLADVLEKIDSFFSESENSLFGRLGAVSGLLMNKAGIGECTMFRW